MKNVGGGQVGTPLLHTFPSTNHESGLIKKNKTRSKNQAQCQTDPGNLLLIDKEQEMYLQFVDLSNAEEAFKKQKSRVQWLGLGDKNTQFFHHKLKSHCMRNKILSLNTLAGVRITDPKEIKLEILMKVYWVLPSIKKCVLLMLFV